MRFLGFVFILKLALAAFLFQYAHAETKTAGKELRSSDNSKELGSSDNSTTVAASQLRIAERTWPDSSWRPKLERLAIQSGGRVKPFDTFAREGAELLTGKSSYRGLSATDFIFSIAVEPQRWQHEKFLQVNHRALKTDLGLAELESQFSPDQLMSSTRLMPLFQELDAKQKAQEKLDPYFQALQRLGSQLSFLQEMLNGRALRFVPHPPGKSEQNGAWLSFEQFPDELKIRFALMAAGFTAPEAATRAKLGDYVEKFGELARSQNPALYPEDKNMLLETAFNKAHPFRWAWILSLLAAVVMVFAFYSPAGWLYASGMALFGLSFATQVSGFALRCWIAGRPPVTNMYESVLWVSFGCMLFGLVLELIYRKRVIALGSLIFATVCLIIADNVSGVLDDGIHPLEPVLRSNYWLTIHVLTITLGYAAFALSLVLGNIGLGQIAFTCLLYTSDAADAPARLLRLSRRAGRSDPACRGHDSRRLVGRRKLGTLLGLGSQGNMGADRAARLRGASARAISRYGGTFRVPRWLRKRFHGSADGVVRGEFRARRGAPQLRLLVGRCELRGHLLLGAASLYFMGGDVAEEENA